MGIAFTDPAIHINRHRKERDIPALNMIFLMDNVIYPA
jgi:hypothetical protein